MRDPINTEPAPHPAELRRLAEAATPGPWESGVDQSVMALPASSSDAECAIVECRTIVDWTPRTTDAEFIAAANPAVILDLLYAAEALERVKALHHPTLAPTSMHFHCEPSECDQAGDGELRDECDNCREWYPCETIRAIDGEHQP